MTTYRNLHVAVLEIAFSALGPDGLPLVASMPLETHKPALEQILRAGQQAGELRDFDVQVMAGLVRSAVTHSLSLACANRRASSACRRTPRSPHSARRGRGVNARTCPVSGRWQVTAHP
jgi:hypothetical protein